MRQNPERLAWTILLAAFVVFCVAVIGLPLLVRSYLVHDRQRLNTQISAQRGTVRVERGGSSRVDATSLGDTAPLELFKGDRVRTGALDEGLLLFQRPADDGRETLISVVIYDNSELQLIDAFSPRFGVSSGAHKASLQIGDGRVRIEVQPSSDGRPVQVEARTEHVRVTMSEGSYALDVSQQQTTTTVRRGAASVRSGDQELKLANEQSAIAGITGLLEGPLPAERNLIVNGDFSEGTDTGWVAIYNPPEGSAIVSDAVDETGTAVARFEHAEAQPAEVGLIQTLNRNVKDATSLVLHLKVRIDYQSLSVCGSQGSECPVLVSVDYIDAAGGDRQWVHGFYAYEDPAQAGTLPYYCLTCPAPSSGNHDQVPEKSWFLYDSPNLMEIDSQELRPVVIQSVRVYASGHEYDSMVTDVELLAQE
jgi:hypothetical protein